MTTKRIFLWLLLLGLACSAPVALAEDGYDLWLRYRPLPSEWLEAYHRRTTEVIPGTPSATLDLAAADSPAAWVACSARHHPLHHNRAGMAASSLER